MSNQQNPPIIVTGGSINLELDETLFTPNGKTARGLNKFSCTDKQITRVVLALNGTVETFDVTDGKVRVEIHCDSNDKS